MLHPSGAGIPGMVSLNRYPATTAGEQLTKDDRANTAPSERYRLFRHGVAKQIPGTNRW
jgi:hypothetical protein